MPHRIGVRGESQVEPDDVCRVTFKGDQVMKNRYIVGVAFMGLLAMVTGCQKTAPASSSVDMRDQVVDKHPVSPQVEDRLVPPKDQIGEEGLDSMRKTSKEIKPAGLEDVYFDFDQWSVRSDMASTLENNAFWLHENPNATVQLEGFCDEKGTEEYNLALGERRAKSASAFLADLGIAPGRVSVISYGEEKPACTEGGDSCDQKNRRVHFAVK